MSIEGGTFYSSADSQAEFIGQQPGFLVVLVGPTASGKSSVGNELVTSHGFIKLVTTTTRDLREDEIAGVDYKLTSTHHFEAMIANNEMAEWNKYGDYHYGLPKKDLEPLFSGTNMVWVGDTSLGANFREKLTASYGEETIRRLLPSTAIVFIGTPSLITLHDRFLNRETDTKIKRNDFRRRIRRDWQDWTAYNDRFPHIVINQNNGLSDTVSEVLTIIRDQQELNGMYSNPY